MNELINEKDKMKRERQQYDDELENIQENENSNTSNKTINAIKNSDGQCGKWKYSKDETVNMDSNISILTSNKNSCIIKEDSNHDYKTCHNNTCEDFQRDIKNFYSGSNMDYLKLESMGAVNMNLPSSRHKSSSNDNGKSRTNSKDSNGNASKRVISDDKKFSTPENQKIFRHRTENEECTRSNMEDICYRKQRKCPFDLHHIYKKFLMEKRRKTQRKILKCKEFLNNKRTNKIFTTKTLEMKKKYINSFSYDHFNIEKCNKKVLFKNLFNDDKNCNLNFNNNSKTSSFFSCKSLQNLNCNKLKNGNHHPILSSKDIIKHFEFKNKVKNKCFTNYSDNRIYSCSCRCDHSNERNAYSDTYVIYSPQKKKKRKKKKKLNIHFYNESFKEYMYKNTEENVTLKYSSKCYELFLNVYKKRIQDKFSKYKELRLRKKINFIPYENYNLTIRSIKKRKKIYSYFRKNKKCFVKKKRYRKKNKCEQIGAYDLREEANKVINEKIDVCQKEENVPTVSNEKSEEGELMRNYMDYIPKEEETKAQPIILQGETAYKSTVSSIKEANDDNGELIEMNIEVPINYETNQQTHIEAEESMLQSKVDLIKKSEDVSKEEKLENEPIMQDVCNEMNNHMNKVKNACVIGKDKCAVQEGPYKELRITGKNFIKYDEELFENLYNDTYLKFGKIVTNKSKKYFLTYKIIKDFYFRILILNKEKLEKNILQVIAIQDVILYDKNVKILSDAFYVRNNNKMYAVKFLKVFSLKYLKKLRKTSEIIFSDMEEEFQNVNKENCESAQSQTADETKSTFNIMENENIKDDDLSKKEITESLDEINENNLEVSEMNQTCEPSEEGIKENVCASENTYSQQHSREYSNNVSNKKQVDSISGSGNKYGESKNLENNPTINLNDESDRYNINGNAKLKKDEKINDKGKTLKGTNKMEKKSNEMKEDILSNDQILIKGSTKDRKRNIDMMKRKNSKKFTGTTKRTDELIKNMDVKKCKKKSNFRLKSENEACNKEQEEHSYTGIIYNDKIKFYFNIQKLSDIINIVKGSEEKTRFYIDTNNNNIKKKLKLFKKVEKTLFLENLVIDDEEVLFKRPKFFNCIIEECFDNFSVLYETENGNLKTFDNKLDRLKKKKANKTDTDASNKYIELKDEEKGFKYIGYRVSFELKKDNKKKSHFKTGIIKYYSPKYKQFFIHHIENIKSNSSVADSPKSTNRDTGYTKSGSRSNTIASLFKESKEYNLLVHSENPQFDCMDNEVSKNMSNNHNVGLTEDVDNDNNTYIGRNREELMYLNYERRLDEENEKKKCDFTFSDIKGWYSPHFYNIKVLKTYKEFERFDILDKNDKRKEQVDFNILNKKDECSICKSNILFIKGHDHYTNSLSTIIYDLSSEIEKKEIDESNMINVYWGIKCFICSKKFHANCLDDEVIITKGYDKNVLMKEYKKYIYKNSLKRDKKCFKNDKNKGSRNASKKEERSKKVKKNINDSKSGDDPKSIIKSKKCFNRKRIVGNGKNGSSRRTEDVSNVSAKEEIENMNEKFNKNKKKGNNVSTSQNECGKNDSEIEYKSDDKEDKNKSDDINDEEYTDVETNNCAKSKNKKSRKCINYVPSVKYNDVSYKKYVCKDCYRCIYCCESIYNYKQTPNIANYVICKSCNMVAHGSCCFPNVPDIYLFNWKCDDCLKCNKCDYSNLCFINYNEWELHLDCCINCYKEYEKKNFCIMCNEKYEIDDSNKWVQCDVCKFWIHLSCDKNESRNIETLSIKSINYKCPTCRSGSFYDKIERILYLFFLLDKYKNFTFHVPINFYIYWRIVKIPMNLYIMKKKIWEKKYNNISEFLYDFILIIHNAKTVHMPNTPIYKNACFFEKKGRVIVKNMFNMNNEELNKCFDECLENYKKISKEEATNDNNNKNEEENKNYDGLFLSDGHKITTGAPNTSRDDIFGKNIDTFSDKKNITSHTNKFENMKYFTDSGIMKETTNMNEYTKSDLHNGQDNSGNIYSRINNYRDASTKYFDNNAAINDSRTLEGCLNPPYDNNMNNIAYQSHIHENANGAFDKSLQENGTNLQASKKVFDFLNDFSQMEKSAFGTYDNNPLDRLSCKDDMMHYNCNSSNLNKNHLNNNMARKRKLENLEKDITQYELYELLDFKSDSVFIHKNKEMFISLSTDKISYNILHINTKGKIYFNRSYDKFDEFDVCKIGKVHLMKKCNNSAAFHSTTTIKGCDKGQLQWNNYSSNEKENLLNDNCVETKIISGVVKHDDKVTSKDGKYFEVNYKQIKDSKIRYNNDNSNVFVNQNIFMIEIIKEKIKMNHVIKEKTKVLNPVNNSYKFLKCVQIIFFGEDQNDDIEGKEWYSYAVNMSHLTNSMNCDNSTEEESMDDVSMEYDDRSTGNKIYTSLDDIIMHIDRRKRKYGSTKNYQGSNCSNNPSYESFLCQQIRKKKMQEKKIKLFNNDILKEHCYICGCIKYKNPFVYCSACGVSIHYSCANISNPFLFNLTDYDEHRKEINQIYNIITRNFKCNNCIKCAKCDVQFSDADRDNFYSNITNIDTCNGDNLAKKTSIDYFYNLKAEVVNIKKDKNVQTRKNLNNMRLHTEIEKVEVGVINESNNNTNKNNNNDYNGNYSNNIENNIKDEERITQPSPLIKMEVTDISPNHHKYVDKAQCESMSNDNYQDQRKDSEINNNLTTCSKKRKKQNAIDTDTHKEDSRKDLLGTYTSAYVKNESETVSKNMEVELTQKKKKMSQHKKTNNNKKSEENENMEQNITNSIVNILSIHDESQKIMKCFCCGKSSHSECFYRIDRIADFCAHKNDQDAHKRTVKHVSKRHYVKKNYNKKVPTFKNEKPLVKLEKELCSTNSFDDMMLNHDNISRELLKDNVLDNSFNETISIVSKNASPRGNREMGDKIKETDYLQCNETHNDDLKIKEEEKNNAITTPFSKQNNRTLVRMISPLKANTPKKGGTDTHFSSSLFYSYENKASAKSSLSKNRRDGYVIQSASVISAAENGINSKVKSIITSNELTMNISNEGNTSKYDFITNDLWENGIVPNDEFINKSLKGIRSGEMSNETVVINGKKFNKHLINEVYEVIKNKKNVKIKHFLHLFSANIDETLVNYLLCEILNGLNTYLNDKLNYYRLNKYINNTMTTTERVKKTAKEEKHYLFDKRNLILNDNEEKKISEIIAKIYTLISETSSIPLNRKASYSKRTNKKNNTNCKNHDSTINPNEKKSSSSRSDNLICNNSSDMNDKNNTNFMNDTLFKKNDENSFTSSPFAVRCTEYNKNFALDIDTLDQCEMKQYTSSNPVNSFDFMNNVKSLGYNNDMNNVNHMSVHPTNGVGNVCSASVVTPHGDTNEHLNASPINNAMNKKNKNGSYMNKSLYKILRNFNEKNLKKFNFSGNINSSYSSPNMGYSPIKKIINLDKTNNIKMNVNNMGGTYSDCNSNIIDMSYMNSRISSTPHGNINNYSNVPIVNNTNNIKNYNGENMCNNSSFSMQNTNVDSGNNMYNLISTNNNMNTSSTVNINDFRVNSSNMNDINIVQNMSILNNNNVTINVNNMDGKNDPFMNFSNLGNIGSISTMSNMNNMMNVGGINRIGSMSRAMSTGVVNSINSMNCGDSIFNENPTSYTNSMNNGNSIFNKSDYNENEENVFHFNELKKCNTNVNPLSHVDKMNHGRSYTDVINMKYTKNFHNMNNINGSFSNNTSSNVYMNETFFQNPQGFYNSNEMDYTVNEMSLEKNIYRSDIYNNDINLHKSNYYFYNNMGTRNNSPTATNNVTNNVNMPLDYNTLRNSSISFKGEMHTAPFDSRTNNEYFEINRKLIHNVNTNNEPIFSNDSNNFILYNKDIQNMNKDGSYISFFQNNIRFGNTSDMSDMISPNKFNDMHNVYNKSINKKDHVQAKTLLKSNISNLEKIINNSKNKKSFNTNDRLTIGGNNNNSNICNSNYNYICNYSSNYNYSYNHNNSSCDPSAYKFNENESFVANVNERGISLSPYQSAENMNTNYPVKKLNDKNVLKTRVEKNISNNSEHQIKDIQIYSTPLDDSKKHVAYNDIKQTAVDLCNEVKNNLQTCYFYGNGEMSEGEEVLNSKKRKLKFFPCNVLIKKENDGIYVNEMDRINAIEPDSNNNPDETANTNIQVKENRNICEQMTKKKKKDSNSSSIEKECKKERKKTDNNTFENGNISNDFKKKKRKGENELSQCIEKGDKKKSERKGSEKADKKSGKKIEKKSDKTSDLKEEENKLTEETNPAKDIKNAEKEKEQNKSKGKEQKRKGDKTEKDRKEVNVEKTTKGESEKKRTKVKKEEEKQERKKEVKEKKGKKNVKGKDKIEENKIVTKKNDSLQEKDKNKKNNEKRRTKMKIKKEVDEKRTEMEITNGLDDKKHLLKEYNSMKISANNKFICDSTNILNRVLKNGNLGGRFKMGKNYRRSIDEDLCLYSDTRESDNSALNTGLAGNVRKRNRINKLSTFLKKNKFMLKSKFKRVTPNSYLCQNCVVLYKNDFSFNSFNEEIRNLETQIREKNNETTVNSETSIFHTKKETNEEKEVCPEKNSLNITNNNNAIEGKDKENSLVTINNISYETNVNGVGSEKKPTGSCAFYDEREISHANHNEERDGEKLKATTNLDVTVINDVPKNDKKAVGAFLSNEGINIRADNIYDVRGVDNGSGNSGDNGNYAINAINAHSEKSYNPPARENTNEKNSYFSLNSESYGKKDPEWNYWMNKISAHNNEFFNRAYLREKKEAIDLRHFFESKQNIYKCSICCMIYEYKTGGNDDKRGEERDNFNCIFVCNACSLQYASVHKYTTTHNENNSNKNNNLSKMNKERNDKRKLYELVYFIIKMSYTYMYYKKNFFKEFCIILDEIFRRNKSSARLLHLLYYSNVFFKYDEFFLLFYRKIKRDIKLRTLFTHNYYSVTHLGLTYDHVMKYLLNLFYVRIYTCSNRRNRKGNSSKYTPDIYHLGRKLLFYYHKNGKSYFEQIVNNSIYFLHLYYLYKIHNNGLRKKRTYNGVNKLAGEVEKSSTTTTIQKIAASSRKKRRKVNQNLLFKIKNTKTFANLSNTFNQKESKFFFLHKENIPNSMNNSGCNNAKVFKNKRSNGREQKLFNKRNSKGVSSLLLYEKAYIEYQDSIQNKNDIIGSNIFYSMEYQKKIKQYIKKIKYTIRNKLNLYVKIMLNLYTQESLNMIKYKNIDSKRIKKRRTRTRTKTCLLCHYGNYLFKGRLIPFYDIFIHSECLKWSLNCIQYYKLNSNSCECRNRMTKRVLECQMNVKNNPSNNKKETKSLSTKRNKKKSAGNGVFSTKGEILEGNKDNVERSNQGCGVQVKNAIVNVPHVNGSCPSTTFDSYTNKVDDMNVAGETRVKREEQNRENQAYQDIPIEDNVLKVKMNPDRIVNVKKNIKNIILMNNFEWTENINFFHNYEHIIEIDEDDVKEIIYDCINSTCYLCGYKNASVYCSNENCNVKFHLNCAFYSTVVRNYDKNIFFHYLKCFNLIKFNKDTIFYKLCRSYNNAKDKELVHTLYKDIFPVHIIYKMKKVWCNKCWNSKKIYNSFYIMKKNMQCSSRKEQCINTEKSKKKCVNVILKDEEELRKGNIFNQCNKTKENDTTIGLNQEDMEKEKEKDENDGGGEKVQQEREHETICAETDKKKTSHKKKIDVIGSFKNIIKHFIHFYFENESYYVMDKILYNINECVRIKYKNKSLDFVHNILSKESKIENKMKQLENIINECTNKSGDKSFVDYRSQLIYHRNGHSNETPNKQGMNKKFALSTCGDMDQNNMTYMNDIDIQDIIDNKNIENIFKCYFILKYFLYIGSEITLKNEEYFFLKKKKNLFAGYVHENNEKKYDLRLSNVLHSSSSCSMGNFSSASRKETAIHFKEKNHKGNLPIHSCINPIKENIVLHEPSGTNKEQQEPCKHILYTTFIDDESELDNENSEIYISSNSENEMEEVDITNYYDKERKEKQSKGINLYFELTDINKKVNITRLQKISTFNEFKENNLAYLNMNQNSETKKNMTKGNGISNSATVASITTTTISSNMGGSRKKGNVEQPTSENNNVTDKKEYFLNMIMNDKNDVYIKRINERLFSNYKYNTRNNRNFSKCKIIKIESHNILHMGEIVKYNGEKRIYPCGFLNMKIFFNLPSSRLFHIYKHANIGNSDEKKKILQKIFLQIRATYIFSITLKNGNFFFSIILFPLISINHFSEVDAQNFVLAESHDIQEAYEKFLLHFKPNDDNNTCITEEYKKCIDKYMHLLEHLQTYIYKSVEHNIKSVDPHDFFGLTSPCVIYQLKYKLFKYMWKILNNRIKNYIRRSNEREEIKKRVRNCTREVIYNDNLFCKYSNIDSCIFKENEKEKEKNTRKTVKYKYNINSAMSYRYLMNISSNSRLYVKKSSIHGYGLYTCEFINEGEPVIEYIGEYIRNIISDKREKHYDKIESSCYMFRLNENIIIDATKWGNVSRFINHSCEPNCFCKIVICDQNLKHIVIFAKRDIVAHEEITYDYQFGVESEGKKLMCLCGSSTCLGRMN
ncbi:SET domain containing protein [Plasmodium gonderi]|uniref:[histone H3]-lysine(4) N-trimethyltransferase n=1 Tax=Plasmodium gonderi TaxID=77519 RepID=A0A1Y1JNU7_PLAGO|nr:SET domain containing protein [Plasmodium gonderi]GAW81734.1 SET domain containing protein [Plasmodium gonderi]